MRDYLRFFPVFLSFILITGTPYGSMAAGTPLPPLVKVVTSIQPVTPPGTNGLLPGMTPGNYKIPSGWSLVRAQDFEGTIPAGEEVWGASGGTAVTTNKPHSGSKSIQRLYDHDQNSAGYWIGGSNIGPYTEIYVSFYEWTDSTALFNDEYWLAWFVKNSPVYQEVIVAYLWAHDNAGNPTFNGPKAMLHATSQGNRDHHHASLLAAIPTGAWVQWEIHYRPNTTDNSSNGFIRIYKDGTLYHSNENANLNGTVSMNSSSLLIGGLYTKLVWMKDSPTCSVPSGCSSGPGVGTDYCTGSKGWSGQVFSKPVCAPIDPPLPSFNRFIDDIILMKR